MTVTLRRFHGSRFEIVVSAGSLAVTFRDCPSEPIVVTASLASQVLGDFRWARHLERAQVDQVARLLVLAASGRLRTRHGAVEVDPRAINPHSR